MYDVIWYMLDLHLLITSKFKHHTELTQNWSYAALTPNHDCG